MQCWVLLLEGAGLTEEEDCCWGLLLRGACVCRDGAVHHAPAVAYGGPGRRHPALPPMPTIRRWPRLAPTSASPSRAPRTWHWWSTRTSPAAPTACSGAPCCCALANVLGGALAGRAAAGGAARVGAGSTPRPDAARAAQRSSICLSGAAWTRGASTPRRTGCSTRWRSTTASVSSIPSPTPRWAANAWGALQPALPLEPHNPTPLARPAGLNPRLPSMLPRNHCPPLAQETMDLVREKGLFSFYEDGHGECCRVRKVRARSAAGPLAQQGGAQQQGVQQQGVRGGEQGAAAAA